MRKKSNIGWSSAAKMFLQTNINNDSSSDKTIKLTLTDDRMLTLLWLIKSNEEYFYYQTNHIYSKTQSDTINRCLSSSRIRINWIDRLINFIHMGKSKFGIIYRAYDHIFDEYVVVKQMNNKAQMILKHISYIKSIFNERHAFLKANSSPYIVKLLGTYVDNYTKTYWFIFEYCIGDLSTFLSEINVQNKVINILTEPFIKKLWIELKNETGVKFDQLIYIYIFELMAALNFLADRKIIHGNIKPDNILVSLSGHLKLSDLGLTERLRWIEPRSALCFLNKHDSNPQQPINNIGQFYGTIAYSDPESLILTLKPSLNIKNIYSSIKTNEYLPIKSFEQEFLYDLFSAGLCCLDLLFFSANPFKLNIFNQNTFNFLKLASLDTLEEALWTTKLVYEKPLREKILYNFFKHIIDKENAGIIDFLRSIFLPRPIRAQGYLKEVELYSLQQRLTRPCIDLDKIEIINYYRLKNITRFSVHSIPINKYIIDIYKQDQLNRVPIHAKDFHEAIDKHADDISMYRHIEIKENYK